MRARQPRDTTAERARARGDSSLTIAELLTGWLANARGLHEWTTHGSCTDYARFLEASQRVGADAEALCERLRARTATIVADETGNAARPANRLTPPG